MQFSVGVLYSVKDFLEFIIDKNYSEKDIKSLKKFRVVSMEEIIRVSAQTQWIYIRPDGLITITEKGRELLTCKDYVELLRLQLKHIIVTVRPTWSTALFNGRLEVKKYLDSEILQCFEEAELFVGISDHVINWWDFVSEHSRSMRTEKRLETGREGEKRSYEYEKKRIGIAPIWQSLDSNYSGFDILSKVKKDNPEKYLIEVKSTKQKISDSVVHISRGEWLISKESKHYYYHFWSLNQPVSLFVVNKKIIDRNVSQNVGYGLWESVAMPFGKVVQGITPIIV